MSISTLFKNSSTEMTTCRSWTKQKVLGQGSHGTVYLVTPCDNSFFTTTVAAVKSAEFDKCNMLMEEASFLFKLRSNPYIIQCYGDDVSIENKKVVYNLLLEYAPGGTLSDLRKDLKEAYLPDHVAACYMDSLLRGLAHIHKKGVVHCDIKPENILVFTTLRGINKLKIGDFGLAKKVGEEKGYRGTLLYASPEAVGFGVVEPPSDIWSLGCTMVRMMTGKRVWSCHTKQQLINTILHDEPEIPRDISETAQDFIKRCLAKDVKDRWTAEMLLNHPFLVLNSFRIKSNISSASNNPFGSQEWVSGLNIFTPRICAPPDYSLYQIFEKENECAPADYLPHQRLNKHSGDQMYEFFHQILDKPKEICAPPGYLPHQTFNKQREICAPPPHQIFNKQREQCALTDHLPHQILNKQSGDQMYELYHEIFNKPKEICAPPDHLPHQIFNKQREICAPPPHQIFNKQTEKCAPPDYMPRQIFDKKREICAPPGYLCHQMSDTQREICAPLNYSAHQIFDKQRETCTPPNYSLHQIFNTRRDTCAPTNCLPHQIFNKPSGDPVVKLERYTFT